MAKKTLSVLLGALLDLLALAREVRLHLVGVPAVVWRGDLVLPVGLDEVDKVLAVGSGRVRDIMVGEPSLELSLVPLVVSYQVTSVQLPI